MMLNAICFSVLVREYILCLAGCLKIPSFFGTFFSNNVDITIIAQVWTQTKLGTDCDKKIQTYGNGPC